MGKLLNLKEKGLLGEILRFIVTGGVATIIDFGVYSLVAALIPDSWGFWETALATAAGFLVSLVVNYILSAFWVYKNVDEKVDKKSTKNIVLFVVLSTIGLFLGIGINAAFVALDNAFIHVDYQNWLGFITDKEHYSFVWKQFLFAVLFFGIKTLLVLTWNYLSRKKLIFKSPEDELDEQE